MFVDYNYMGNYNYRYCCSCQYTCSSLPQYISFELSHSIGYHYLGLQIDFLGSSYEDAQNPMTCICIYAPQQDQEEE